MNNSYFPPEMTLDEIQAFREEMEFWLDQEADPLYNVNVELTIIGGPNMSNQPEALRLAEYHECAADLHSIETAAELRRLHADVAESEALRERLSGILKATAIALRGPEPALVSWSWHDLPERAAALVAQRDALLEALKEIVDAADGTGWDQLDASFSKARAAIKAAEGEKE